MSEPKRMTDERMHEIGGRAYPEWRNDDKKALWVETERARASEAEKDKVIKALADVLEAHNNRLTTNYQSDPGAHEIVISTYERRKMREALKLAGRLP